VTIGINTFDDGGMRNGVWPTHLVTPGQPCLVCNRQLDPAHIQSDKPGLYDNPVYIRSAAVGTQPTRQNVAALSASVSASLLAQFTSLTGGTSRDRKSRPAAILAVRPHP
jgi:hypothetical protein